MRIAMTCLMLVMLAFLSSCNKPSDPPPVKIMEQQRQQLQKAKDVEQTLQNAAELQRKALEAQTSSPEHEK
jgi:hypothetical protein